MRRAMVVLLALLAAPASAVAAGDPPPPEDPAPPDRVVAIVRDPGPAAELDLLLRLGTGSTATAGDDATAALLFGTHDGSGRVTEALDGFVVGLESGTVPSVYAAGVRAEPCGATANHPACAFLAGGAAYGSSMSGTTPATIVLVALRGRGDVSVEPGAAGWRATELPGGFATRGGDEGTAAGAEMRLLGAEAFAGATLPVPFARSATVGQGPCEWFIAAAAGAYTLTGGTTEPLGICPQPEDPGLAALATAPTTWRLLGAGAGVHTGVGTRTRLVAFDLAPVERLLGAP